MHGITSLTAWQANPADILAGNRGHWGVENREHYVRDRTFDEDRSQVRTGASPQFLATARNIVMSLLRLAGCENVARGMEYLSRRLDQILTLLGVLPEPIRKGDAYNFADDPEQYPGQNTKPHDRTAAPKTSSNPLDKHKSIDL